MKIDMRNIALNVLVLIALVVALHPRMVSADTVDLISDLEKWSGVELQHDEADAVATWQTSGQASFTYPDGEKGWHRIGLDSAHDGSADWRSYYGVRLKVLLSGNTPLVGTVTLETAPVKHGNQSVPGIFTSDFAIAGEGWHEVTIPLDSFDYEKDRPSVLFAVKTLQIKAAYAEGPESDLAIKDVRLVKAERIALRSEVRSRSAKAGESVAYELELTNCTDSPQAVTLTQSVRGREAAVTTITPSQLVLTPGESQSVTVAVTVSERMPAGSHERQLIQVLANGHAAGEIEYITNSYLEHPYILHTPERWEAVHQKIADQDWAKQAADQLIANADKWEVPEFFKDKVSSRTRNRYLFNQGAHKGMLNAAIAYQLTGDKKYAEKTALFLKRLADPETGYPDTLQANSHNLVKEGGVFQAVGQAYDIIYDSGALSDVDHKNLEATFRLYFRIIDEHISRGTVSNWMVSEFLGAIYCAMAIQDMATVERFIKGPGGFYDHVTHGVMADGWWFECSIGYNTWVAKMFTELALAMQPWGVDYIDAAFPAAYSLEYNIPYADVEQRMDNYYGMPFQKYGALHKSYVNIKDMWDALPPYIDYNGVMFAVNDSVEKEFKDNAYELAYAVYGDPVYASVIKLTGKRDLLYGVPELPEDTPKLGSGSASSDNAGVVMLRSNAEGKEPREKIQAVMKYGTHGGYHGHFDRAGLNSLMRYGRSFYGPEHIWYSYPNFMYKFFVQTSLPHNMVVVNMKQQEPVDSKKLLFSTGDLMQSTAVETNARWCNPPYGGIAYENYFGRPFSDKIWDEARYVPIPDDAPKWGDIGEYSERVMQRRLMTVTDDYVLLADFLDSTEHDTFDCLFNIKGFQGLEADQVEHLRHTDSMDPDPLLAAQFITDCNWYQTSGTTKVSFITEFGPGADNAGTRIYGLPGVLKMDVYNAWPQEREVMIGTLPEAHGVNRKLWWTVKGDDNVLAEGKFGAWLLGRDEIDVSIQGMKQLTLVTKTSAKRNAKKTLFWASPVIVTADGKEIPLSDLDLNFNEIDDSPKDGLDYNGGPVKISGRAFPDNVPANPVDADVEGTVTVDLAGLNAVRFKAFIGGDYPLGDETYRRKSLSFRTTGKQTRYLTVIEPYEDQKVIKQVTATSADEITIDFVDGRQHVLTIENLEAGQDLSVQLKEYRDGELVREEASQ